MRTIKLRLRDIEVCTARKDLWSTVEEPEDIQRVVQGIVDASRMMHSKGILDQDQLLELGQILYRVWEDNGGHAKVRKPSMPQ